MRQSGMPMGFAGTYGGDPGPCGVCVERSLRIWDKCGKGGAGTECSSLTLWIEDPGKGMRLEGSTRQLSTAAI